MKTNQELRLELVTRYGTESMLRKAFVASFGFLLVAAIVILAKPEAQQGYAAIAIAGLLTGFCSFAKRVNSTRIDELYSHFCHGG